MKCISGTIAAVAALILVSISTAIAQQPTPAADSMTAGQAQRQVYYCPALRGLVPHPSAPSEAV
jgi:hypothetical protein